MVDDDTGPVQRTGADAVLRSLLHSSFGLFPDELARVLTELIEEHTTASDVELLLVDLDQEVLMPLGEGTTRDVEWSPAGRAFREQQPLRETTPDGRRLWLPILDSAERLGVLGLSGGEEVPVDDWLAVSALLGELIVSKSTYGDRIALVRRQRPVSLAAEMRWALLPPLTFSSPIVSVSGLLQPSYGVAGDAFDYAVGEARARVAVIDAMGHGMLAARMANLVVGAFRSGRRSDLDPEEIMSMIDAGVKSEFGDSLFVTGQMLDVDLHTGVATVWTAGHPPPAHLRAGKAPERFVVKPAPPFGLGNGNYEETSIQLEPGELVLLLSDGAYEARAPDGSIYGVDRLLTVVQDYVDAGDPAPEVLRRTMRDILLFQGEAGVRDDTTLALVRWRPDAVGQPARPAAAELREI